ncbi:sodium channel protein 60E-like isoform X2 [Ischnura elegans]|uniref:sodium channel protein 60E-like isoform X2 n=1 Tax=Ischnura elegans TaxID=197161 RepID=UPI001ED866AD|nr:sodium channel protein 60E-like isoform X2 [Ischnura elegans]
METGEVSPGGGSSSDAAGRGSGKGPPAKTQVKPFTRESLERLENKTVQLVREYGFQPRRRVSVEDGSVLPEKFEPFPRRLYGRPLEEIDNFIYDETFCVVSKRFKKNYIHRFTATPSFFLFSPWNAVRRACIFLCTNQYFDYVVMTTILLNCVFLAMTEPMEEAEYIFLAIYTAEMTIKSVAKGFILNKYTYLRNPWNWLDFIVITSGYVTIGMEVGNLAGLRTFRVLRALKTVSIMPGLKTIINALLHSFKQLAEVMTLTIFCLMVFALFALQVYMGELRNKCVRRPPAHPSLGAHPGGVVGGVEHHQPPPPLPVHHGVHPSPHHHPFYLLQPPHGALDGADPSLTLDENNNKTYMSPHEIWLQWIKDEDNWLKTEAGEPVLCGNTTGARHCPNDTVCLCVGENPNHGYTSFDNFLWSMLTTFQLITLDYWENVYNMVLATSGPISVSFFTVVVFFGSFYLINLMLAVVALSYEEEAEITQEERRKDLTDHRDDSTFSFDPSKINVKTLDKNNRKKIDSRKGILLASYSKKKTRKRKRAQPPGIGAATQGSGTEGGLVEGKRPSVGSIAARASSSRTPSPRHSTVLERPRVLVLPSVPDLRHRASPGIIAVIPAEGSAPPEGHSPQRSRAPVTAVVGGEEKEGLHPNALANYGAVLRELKRVLPPRPTAGNELTDYLHRGRLHPPPSRQPSSTNSESYNRESSLEDSGVVDDHEGGDVTSEEVAMVMIPIPQGMPGNQATSQSLTATPQQIRRAPPVPPRNLPTHSPAKQAQQHVREEIVCIGSKQGMQTATAVGAGRTTQLIKCNGVSPGRAMDAVEVQQLYAAAAAAAASSSVPPDYLSHIVVLDDLTDRNCEKCAQCCVDYEGWVRFQNCLYRVVKDPLFDLLITLCIVLNTAFLAMEHHGMSESVRQALDIGNKVFTSIFTFECFLKLLAMSKDFFDSGWNIFDLIIVSASLLDLSFELIDSLSVLRGLRLLRVLKLAQSWTTMKVLLSIIISTLGALGNLTFVLVIVIYIFAVIGMQLFSKDYTPERFYPDPVPRWNFTDFFHSFMMIFRILCGEWIEPLWDCMRAEVDEGPETCFAIFLPALVMGNFMVLNLFLALLLNSFNSEEIKMKKEEVGEESKLALSFERLKALLRKRRRREGDPAIPEEIAADEEAEEVQERSENEENARLEKIVREAIVRHKGAPAEQLCSGGGRYALATQQSDSRDESNTEETIEMDVLGSRDDDLEGMGQRRRPNTNSEAASAAPEELETMVPKSTGQPSSWQANQGGGTPCGIGGAGVAAKYPWHALVSYVDELTVGGRRDSQGRFMDNISSFPGFGRRKPDKLPQNCFPDHCYDRCKCCHAWMLTPAGMRWKLVRTRVLRVVDTPAFEWLVLVLIFASSITLCFEDVHLEHNPPLRAALYWTNLAFCALFSIEMVLKWLALGFWKYFTSFWTILDFIIVFVSVFSLLIEENENLRVLRSLRTLRALRPLRAISRWQGMRIVVNALMYAIPSIFNVLLVCLVFWLIFSIMGVQFFGGKFFKCVDDDGELLPIRQVNDRYECHYLNYTWINSKITFDNVGNAYLALFQVATFEGWMEVMADAVDARGVDLQPEREANLYAYLYFVIFIVCGSFFTLNLFIGVIIDNFNMLKKRYEGGVLEMFLTESQKHYYTAMKKLGRKKPQKVIKRPRNQFLAMFYDLSNSRRFEIAIFVLIFLNMLTMGIEHYGQSHAIFFVLEVSNAFFTTVFSLEAIVKIMGLRYHYFTVPWNLFDFVLVLASILGIVMEDIMIDLPVSPTLLRVVRVFRIGRILRLIKAAKGIRKLLFALVVSLPALFNIGALLALITFIYAIIGMSLFGHVRLQGALDDMVNFQTFGRSMQLLFRLMTSAGWNDVLESLMIQPPDCEPDDVRDPRFPNGDCGHPLLAITYFVSFIIINYMIVINMYIAIILENFNQAHQEEEIGIVEDDLEMFYIRWSKYDPHATQFIGFSQLSDFIASLDPPLGIPKPNTVALVSFNLPIARGNKIHCLDILHALVKHVLGHVEENEEFHKLQEQMDVKFKKQFPTRKELEIISSTRIWKRQDKAARLIQSTFREYVRRLKEHEAAELEDGQTQTSSPGGSSAQQHHHQPWHRLSQFLHVRRGSTNAGRRSLNGSSGATNGGEGGSRAGSRKSSEVSGCSSGGRGSCSSVGDLSELISAAAAAWLGMPTVAATTVPLAAAAVLPPSPKHHGMPGAPPPTPTSLLLGTQRLIEATTPLGVLPETFSVQHDGSCSDEEEEPVVPGAVASPPPQEGSMSVHHRHRLHHRRLLRHQRLHHSPSHRDALEGDGEGGGVRILVSEASPDDDDDGGPEWWGGGRQVRVEVHREGNDDDYGS